MPAWVKDEGIWQKAKEKAIESKGKPESKFTDQDWGLVTTIYKNMGGKVGKVNISKVADEIIKDVFAAKKPKNYNDALDLANELNDKLNDSNSTSEKRKLDKEIKKLKKDWDFKPYDFS